MGWARALFVLVVSGVAACGGPDSYVGATYKLRVGERVDTEVPQTAIRFVGVSQDSRCPIDVVCVWAGDAAVQLDVIAPFDSARFDLHTNGSAGPTSRVHQVAIVRLLEVAPAPRSSQPIPAGDYTATVDVSALPMP